jgi:hypothetical protein
MFYHTHTYTHTYTHTHTQRHKQKKLFLTISLSCLFSVRPAICNILLWYCMLIYSRLCYFHISARGVNFNTHACVCKWTPAFRTRNITAVCEPESSRWLLTRWMNTHECLVSHSYPFIDSTVIQPALYPCYKANGDLCNEHGLRTASLKKLANF